MKIKSFFLALAVITLSSASYAATSTLAAASKAAINTILELKISEDSQSELRFGNIQPSSTQETQVGPMVVQLRVNSNIGERYQVTQNISGDLENQDGAKINADHLKFTTSGGNAGASAKTTPQGVDTNTQTIYTSDTQGAGDSIRAEYFLTVPINQAAGDYTALITYTVSSV